MINKTNIRGIKLGNVLEAYLEAIRQRGIQAVEKSTIQGAKTHNEARRTKLATPVSWELLCSIVPETFECHGHCAGPRCTVECRNTPPK